MNDLISYTIDAIKKNKNTVLDKKILQRLQFYKKKNTATTTFNLPRHF
jgi:hypothetical protein